MLTFEIRGVPTLLVEAVWEVGVLVVMVLVVGVVAVAVPLWEVV